MIGKNSRIAIIGGGLSGLYSAYLLEQHGFSHYQIFEARDRLGGRIAALTVEALSDDGAAVEDSRSRFDLGPTWYWPQMQPAFAQLIAELGLGSFAQYDQGDMLFERSQSNPPVQMPGYRNELLTLRLAGGMSALIDALQEKIPADKICYQQQVQAIVLVDGEITLQLAAGALAQFDQVIIAAPPRLIASNVEFQPKLPEPVQHAWLATETWMAPHAKFLAVFPRAFWREQGLSGSARSNIGPMVEIHDASLPSGKAALFGFIGFPAQARRMLGAAQLQQQCQAQLLRLFGPLAAMPEGFALKDWALDPLTATAADVTGQGAHPQPPSHLVADGPWQHKLFGAGSEWSKNYPGYLAGCIEAAEQAVGQMLKMGST